jgi:ribosome-associated protein
MDEDNDDGLGGRSRYRREVSARWRWGERLSALDPEVLAWLPASDVLREAVLEGARTESPNARKRQIAFIDRLIREGTDDERDAIVTFLEDPDAVLRARDAELEATIDTLIAGDDALTDWIDDHPDADAQRVRTLVRNARKDATRRAALKKALRT